MVTTITAWIELYNKEDGRKIPFVTGYRPLFSFERQDDRTSGQIILLDRNEFFPGEEGEVEIRFLKKFLRSDFGENDKFTFSEGETPLGQGIVKRLIE